MAIPGSREYGSYESNHAESQALSELIVILGQISILGVNTYGCSALNVNF